MARDELGDTPGQLRRDLLIVGLAIVSVLIGVWQLTHESEHPGFSWLDVVDLAIVAVFIADFLWQMRKCGDWRAYLRRHWWEVPSLIPVGGVFVSGVPGLALVRGIRLVRLVRVLRLLRIVGLTVRLRRVTRYAGRVARRANLGPILAAGAVVVLVGGMLAFALESDATPAFASLGNAMWWALNVFDNVAYVDFQPTTPGGRVIAGALEVCGVGFIGVLGGSLAGAIIQEPKPDEEEESRA
ncbi:MAG: voltage-gated potassium channel [Thermoplasmata archaeon]|nr:voltage-gated potassium channel [Thermoplasmata archaeon]